MARALTMDMALEVRREAVMPVFFVTMRFPDDGDLNLWTGPGDFVWNGTTFTGTGTLLAIDRVEETAELAAAGISLSISGVPVDLRSLALNASANIEDGTLSLWIGMLWEPPGGAPPELVSDPYRWDYRMDTMTVADQGTNCTIKLDCESILIDLERARLRNYTNEDQQVDYPTDTFFSFVTALQDKTIQWGQG